MPGKARSRLITLSRVAVVGSCAAAIAQGSSAAAATSTVAIQPNTPDIGNCYPFGLGGDEDPGEGRWTPFAAFIYKNVPAFDLWPGRSIAFDTTFTNDADIKLDIALARTTANGSDVPAGGFTKVVSNTQTSSHPAGNTTQVDFDLAYRSRARFDFPGGGLVIRTSSPAPSFLADNTCTGNLYGGNASDPTGFFVKRHVRDADGTAPWDEADNFSIPAFRISNDTGPYPRCGGRDATIVGTEAGEVLRGTPAGDVIAGLGAADRILGGKGKDRICGGAGRDRLKGGPGRDLLVGGPGRDRLRGGPGRDKLRGGPGTDLVKQ